MYKTYSKQNTFIDALEYWDQVIWFHLTKKSSKDVSNDICFIMILDQSVAIKASLIFSKTDYIP